jgi:predicted DNA-binding transcriptional regulator AlpA
VKQDEDRLLVPIPDAQFQLGGVSRPTVYKLVNEGQLTKVNIGTRGFITAKSLEAYVDRLTQAVSGDRVIEAASLPCDDAAPQRPGTGPRVLAGP